MARRIPRCGRCRSTARRRKSWSTNRISTRKALTIDPFDLYHTGGALRWSGASLSLDRSATRKALCLRLARTFAGEYVDIEQPLRRQQARHRRGGRRLDTHRLTTSSTTQPRSADIVGEAYPGLGRQAAGRGTRLRLRRRATSTRCSPISRSRLAPRKKICRWSFCRMADRSRATSPDFDWLVAISRLPRLRGAAAAVSWLDRLR